MLDRTRRFAGEIATVPISARNDVAGRGVELADESNEIGTPQVETIWVGVGLQSSNDRLRK